MLSSWNEGPSELIEQALALLSAGTERGSRAALVLVDEALRVVLRAYIEEAVRSPDDGWRLVPVIPKQRRMAAAESVAALLNLLEEMAAEGRPSAPDLGGIERFHRLRVEAYHLGRGAGVLVETVEVYAALVETLHGHLFRIPLEIDGALRSEHQRAAAAFFQTWERVEDEIRFHVSAHTDLLWDRRRHPTDVAVMVQALRDAGIITTQAALGVRRLWDLRWELAHGTAPVPVPRIHTALTESQHVLAELQRPEDP